MQTPNHIEVRPLLPTDAADLRELRLEALRLDGRSFASSYDAEEKLTAADWERKCTEKNDLCTLGLFSKGELIGMSMVYPWAEDATGETAVLGQSYIKPSYRGFGLGKSLFARRLEWCRKSPQFMSAVLFIRDGNAASTALHAAAGAEYTEPKLMDWADGKKAVGHWYKIELKRPEVAAAPTYRRYALH